MTCGCVYGLCTVFCLFLSLSHYISFPFSLSLFAYLSLSLSLSISPLVSARLSPHLRGRPLAARPPRALLVGGRVGVALAYELVAAGADAVIALTLGHLRPLPGGARRRDAEELGGKADGEFGGVDRLLRVDVYAGRALRASLEVPWRLNAEPRRARSRDVAAKHRAAGHLAEVVPH